MNPPTKHHFVPEVYLKSFANSQKKLRSLKKGDLKTKETSPGKVCYEQDFYTIKRPETKTLSNINDDYYIEKKEFAKMENKYERTLKNILSVNTKTNSNDSIRQLIYSLLQIKRRNPITKKEIIDSYKYEITTRDITFSKEIKELSLKYDNIDPDVYYKEYKKYLLTEDKLHDIYLSGFLNDKYILNNATSKLLCYDINLLCPPQNREFITSDNPGFFICNNKVLNLGGLGGEFVFTFPLTPHRCLFISSKINNRELIKSSRLIPLNESSISQINNITYDLASKLVFSYSNNELLQFT